MTPFASLLTAIQERLKQQVPSIRWIDQDYGQLEYYETRPAVDWPCVLVDFDNFQFEEAGDNLQFANGNVVVRLAFTPFSNTSNITPDQWKEKGLSYYEIEWAIYKALHGWKPNEEKEDGHYGYMLRLSSDNEKREDSIRVRRLVYGITFEDYNACPDEDTMHLPEDLDTEVELDIPD